VAKKIPYYVGHLKFGEICQNVGGLLRESQMAVKDKREISMPPIK